MHPGQLVDSNIITGATKASPLDSSALINPLNKV